MTGGRPIAAFSATISGPRPGKRPIATAAPSGSPMTAEHNVDVRLTPSDSATIAVTRGSRCVTIASASEKLSVIVFIGTAHCAAGLQFYAILTGNQPDQPSWRSTVSGGSFTVDRVPSQP